MTRPVAGAPPVVADLLTADGPDFVSRSVPTLNLTLDGVAGDRHTGSTRKADARTPWHKRGTRIANTRQLSVVSLEECAEIAELLGVPEVLPALLGANLVVGGIPALSLLMPAARLVLPSGATVFVTEQNAPCRHPADKLAAAFGRPRVAAAFARVAVGRRGLVGIVERDGEVHRGDAVRLILSPARVDQPKVMLPAPVEADQASGAVAGAGTTRR